MKRFILWLLGLGLVAILILGGVVLYSSYIFKQKLQEKGEHILHQYAKTLQQENIQLTYTQPSCSGILYFKCQIPSIQVNFDILAINIANLSSKLENLSSKSLTISLQANISLIDQTKNLQAYTTLFSPTTFKALTTLTKTSQTQYIGEIQGSFNSQYIKQTFATQWNGFINPSSKTDPLANLDTIFQNKIQYQTITLNAQSNGFSQALFQAVKSQKAYKGINKQGFDTLVYFIANLSIQSIPAKQMHPLLTQIRDFIIGKTNQINLNMQKSSQEEIFITPSSLLEYLTQESFLQHYNLKAN